MATYLPRKFMPCYLAVQGQNGGKSVASEEHLKILRQGVDVWNEWREKNPELIPDLREADLRHADLSGMHLVQADLRETDFKFADLKGANLSEANLWDAILCHVNLSGANLSKADLRGALLIQANFSGATLTGSSVYGTAVWDIKIDDQTKQQNLVITPGGEAAITVNNLKVAQFIYLLLNNKEIRDVIDTINSKAVLILGRFSEERKRVLDALRDALRNKGFLPIVFDFERPKGRDFTETVKVLAGLSSFVIVDITEPRSVPLELQATVPDYMIPFVPILQDGESEFSMFPDLQAKHDWVLGTLTYDSYETLIEVLDDAVINRALEKRRELEIRKVQTTPARRVSDYGKHQS